MLCIFLLDQVSWLHFSRCAVWIGCKITKRIVSKNNNNRSSPLVAPASLGETHGYCVLQRFAAQRRDACPSPDLALRGAAQLRRVGHVGGARQGRGHHPGESGLVEVRLQPGAVRHVGQAHGVVRLPGAQAALGEGLRHGLLAAQSLRQLQLGHAGHPRRGPAAVVGVEGAEAVAHGRRGRRRGRELGQAVVRRQQGSRGPEHVGGLLALFPLGASVLKPDLQRDRDGEELWARCMRRVIKRL